MCYILFMANNEDKDAKDQKKQEITETDEEMILAYRNGDGEAFKRLVHRYVTPLYNFTARFAGKNDAPDIVQESFVKVWKNMGRFDPNKAHFKTWIFTIAKNTTTDFLRKKKAILFSDVHKEDDEDINSFAANIPDEEFLPDTVLQKLEESRSLNATLLKLRPEYREILTLHYQEEMTFEEIGMVLGKSLNTVKSQHRRAIIELRTLIPMNS